MGGIAEVHLTQLRAVADRVMDTATDIAEMHWPTLDANELRGSAVVGIAAPVLIAARIDDVVANMRGWATAAHMAATAFEGAEIRNRDRFTPR